MQKYKRNRPTGPRKLHSEQLEPRAMLAADVAHNFLFPHDVDDDGSVTPLDALVVVNRLNRGQDDSSSVDRRYHDVDDDSRVTPLDALVLINSINRKAAETIGNSTSQSSVLSNPSTGARVRVELETEGTETELKIRLDSAPISSSFAVSLNDIALGQLMTDARGRGQIVLSQGDDNREHIPLPVSLMSLSPEMELIIGDIVSGKLSQIANVENNGSVVTNPNAMGNNEIHFVAPFDVVTGIIRSAEYEQETERGVTKRKFEAEVERANPNSVFEVTVDGTVVGSFVVDARGKGKLRLTTNPANERDQLMPASFPTVTHGTSVKIGTVQSSFRRTT